MRKDYFTISQVCKVCGISRSTVLRLEKRGLLTPAYCDEKTGYRYYDNHNVSKIMQIKAFLEMGLQYDDAVAYYNTGGNLSVLVEKLEQRIQIEERALEEMKLRINGKNHVTWEFIRLPEYVCYAKEFVGVSTADKYRDMYKHFHETVEKGYRLLANEPLFFITKRTDFLNGKYEDTAINYICCVPLEPDCATEETITIPSCSALSILIYGDYNNIKDAHLFLGEKIRELNLKPTGFPRGLGLVAPYTGKEIQPDKYVSRIAIPVEGNFEQI